MRPPAPLSREWPKQLTFGLACGFETMQRTTQKLCDMQHTAKLQARVTAAQRRQ
jgi:hypothetical protein